MKDHTDPSAKTYCPALWSAVAVVFSFLIAVGFDAIFRILREQAQSTFRVLPAYLFQAATPIFLAGIMLALAWLLFVRLRPGRSSAAVFFISGVIILALYFSQFVPLGIPARTSVIRRIQILLLESGTRSNLFHLASFWAVSGLAALLRPIHHKEPPQPSLE